MDDLTKATVADVLKYADERQAFHDKELPDDDYIDPACTLATLCRLQHGEIVDFLHDHTDENLRRIERTIALWPDEGVDGEY